ncbi:MAG: Hpt domain-containing protein, partial [Alsobacter sp.]
MDALAEIRNIYFDECDEFVGLLEGYLAAMGEGRATDEDIHGAFRAVHSIKGGAGAFALTELVEFSHLFEACLDALRSGRMSITDAPVDVLLQAGDVLGELINAARESRSTPVPPAVVEALQAMSGGKLKRAAPQVANQATLEIALEAPAPVPAAAVSEEPASTGRKVEIKIAPDKGLFKRAIDPRMIFKALRTLGELEVTCDASAVPPVALLEPLDCHLTWSLVLLTEAQTDMIVETLEMFLADDEFLLGDSGSSNAAEPVPAPVVTQSVPEAAAAAAPRAVHDADHAPAPAPVATGTVAAPPP